MPRAHILSVVLALLVAGSAAAQQVFVVAPTPGPGVFATHLQPAVDAAADGDVILVRPSPPFGLGYPGFDVLGKSVVITSDGTGSVRIDAGVRVSGVPAGKSVVLRGLSLAGFQSLKALSVSNCAGTVWVEACSMHSSQSFGPGASLSAASSVAFVRCTMTGGSSTTFPFPTVTLWSGLTASDSTFSLFDCTVTGASSGNGPDATIGATGAVLNGSAMFASGSQIKGGAGGTFWFEMAVPLHGKNGGTGLALNGSTVELLDTAVLGGAGGSGGGLGGPSGFPGTPIVGAGATTLPGTARHFAATSPVREGQTSAWTFQGEPNEVIGVFVALAPSQAIGGAIPGLSAPLLVDLATTVPFLLGTAEADGSFGEGIFIGELPPGMQAAPLYVQSVFVGPSAAALGPGSFVLLLDQAF